MKINNILRITFRTCLIFANSLYSSIFLGTEYYRLKAKIIDFRDDLYNITIVNRRIHEIAIDRSLDKIKWRGGQLYLYQVRVVFSRLESELPEQGIAYDQRFFSDRPRLRHQFQHCQLCHQRVQYASSGIGIPLRVLAGRGSACGREKGNTRLRICMSKYY